MRPVTVRASPCSRGSKLLEHSGDATCVEEVFHLVLAGRAHIGDERRAAAELVEARERQVDAEAARYGGQVHDGVGAATEGMQQGDGVIESGGRDDLREADALLHQVDDLPAGAGSQAQAARISRRDGAVTGQGDAQRFHQRVHGRGGAHDHTVAGAAHEVLFDRLVGLGANRPGQVFGGVTAAIGASAQDLAIVMPVEHGPATEHDGGDIGAGCAHQRGGRSLVAVGQQHDAIQRVAADHLLSVHGRQVAVEHGCRAEVDFAQGDGGEFQREAAGLQDAALDRFADAPQVAVAGVELAVGVADADERAGHVGAVVAHGGGEGAVGQAGDAVFVEEGLGAGRGLGHGSGFRVFLFLPQRVA